MKKDSELLRELFREMNESKIKYCVLRNYELLPDIIGNDVDMLINDNQKEKLISIFLSVAERLGWIILYVRRKYKFSTIVFTMIENNEVFSLKLDVWSELCWRGLPWIDAKYALDTRKEFKGFFVPRGGVESATLLLKELLGGGTVPSKYYDRIVELAQSDEEGFKRCLSTIGELSNRFYIRAIKSDWNYFNTAVGRFKRSIVSGGIASHGLYGVYGFLKHEIKLRVSKRERREGALVVFVGPDGSGKSSVIANVNEMMKAVYPERRIYHMSFALFPTLRTGLGLTRVDRKNEGSKKTKRKRSLIGYAASWAVVVYHTLEFMLGHFIVCRAIRRGELILFDRYYYDFFVQPAYRDLVWPFRKFLLSLVPKPDVAIYLRAKPDTVFSRKQELSVDEIGKQDIIFCELISGMKIGQIINTEEKSIIQISCEISHHILDLFRRKNS